MDVKSRVTVAHPVQGIGDDSFDERLLPGSIELSRVSIRSRYTIAEEPREKNRRKEEQLSAIRDTIKIPFSISRLVSRGSLHFLEGFDKPSFSIHVRCYRNNDASG